MLQRDGSSFLIKLSAIVLFVIFTIFAILVNCIFCAVLFIGHRHFSQRPFYIVARHLLLADALSLFAQLSVVIVIAALPLHLAKDYSLTTFYDYAVTMDTVGQTASFHFVLLQSMSQIAPFLPKQDEIIIRLSVSGTFICMVLWFWNAGFLMLFYVANCGKQFHPILMYFFYICSSAPEDNSRMIWTLMNIWFLAMLLVSLAIYGIGLRTIQRKFRTFHLSLPTTSTGTATEPNTMLPHERKEYLLLQNRQFILLQGCLVSLFSVIRLIVFFAVPWLTQSVLDLDTNAIALANIFGNCITILCFAANPIVFWIFNERVRRIVCQMALLAKAGEGHGVRALFHRSDSNTRNGTPKTC